MTFPSSSGSQAFGLTQALAVAQAQAANVKNQAATLSAQCAAGNVAAQAILNFLTVIADATLMLNKAAAVTGLAAYAQAQLGDVNISAEFQTMLTAMAAVTSSVLSTMPLDPTNTYLMVTSFTPDGTGRTQQRTFTPAQTAGIKTVLDALVATIN